MKKKQTVIPLLPLRDIVVFPGMITPLFVGRSKSISALEEVMSKDKLIFLVTQKDAETDDPLPNEIYEIGCIGKVIQLLKLPDGTMKALIEAQDKARILKYNKLTLKRLEILESKNKNILKFILKIVGKNNSNSPVTAKSNIPVASNSNNPISLHKKDLKIVVNKILNT